MQNINFHIKKIIQFFCILNLFIISIYFSGLIFFLDLSTTISFNLPKTYLFIFINCIIILLFAINLFYEKNIKLPNFHKYIWICIFLMLFLVFIYFFISPFYNIIFWGTREKFMGLFFYIHLFLYAFIFFNILNKKLIHLIYICISIIGFIVSLYGVLQYFGFDPYMYIFQTDFVLGRVYSTMGHPNYLAYFLILIIPIQVYMLKNFKYKIISIIFICFSLLCLFFTYSKAGILGILLGGIIILILEYKKQIWAFFKNKKFLISSVIVLFLFVILIFNNTKLIDQRIDDSVRSFHSRIYIYKTSIEMIKQNPVFGYGIETYGLYYNKNKPAEILQYESVDDFADRPHNFILYNIFSWGIFYTIFYFILLVYIFYKLYKNKKFYILWGVLSLYIAKLFGFSLPVIDVFCISLICIGLYQEKNWNLKLDFYKYFISFVFIVFGIVSFFHIFNFYKADMQMASFLRGEKQITKEILDLNPYFIIYYFPFISRHENINNQLLELTNNIELESRLNKLNFVKNKKEAIEEFETLLADFPNNTKVYQIYIDYYLNNNDNKSAKLICEKLETLVPFYFVNLDIDTERILQKTNPNLYETIRRCKNL